MSTNEPGVVHELIVSLRGQDTPYRVTMASRAAALASVAFAATNWLRKAPADRAGCWLLTIEGTVTHMDERGVSVDSVNVPVAAFDPRELVGVLAVHRTVEPWKETA